MVPKPCSGPQDGPQAQFRIPAWFPSPVQGSRLVPKPGSGFQVGPQAQFRVPAWFPRPVQDPRMVPKPDSGSRDGSQVQFRQLVCCCLQEVHGFHKASACGFVENGLKSSTERVAFCVIPSLPMSLPSEEQGVCVHVMLGTCLGAQVLTPLWRGYLGGLFLG